MREPVCGGSSLPVFQGGVSGAGVTWASRLCFQRRRVNKALKRLEGKNWPELPLSQRRESRGPVWQEVRAVAFSERIHSAAG